jgi:hypothetical protein
MEFNPQLAGIISHHRERDKVILPGSPIQAKKRIHPLAIAGRFWDYRKLPVAPTGQ